MPINPIAPPQGKHEQLIHGQTVQRDKESQRELDLGMPPVEPAKPPVDPKIEEAILKDIIALGMYLAKEGWDKGGFLDHVEAIAEAVEVADKALFEARMKEMHDLARAEELVEASKEN